VVTEIDIGIHVDNIKNILPKKSGIRAVGNQTIFVSKISRKINKKGRNTSFVHLEKKTMLISENLNNADRKRVHATLPRNHHHVDKRQEIHEKFPL
jgi:hypothetical protein